MEKTTLYLPEELQASLRALAKQRKRPQAELIREALTEYVGRQERPLPTSIGMVADWTIPAREARAWIQREWDKEAEDRRRERNG
jgi:hypothetical protein